MNKKLYAGLLAMSISSAALAVDPELCLDCHEPAEDWEGMSSEEILAEAKDLEIKRHADNADLSDDDLKLIISTLLEE